MEKDSLDLTVKAKKRRFKAGADISAKVNRVEVDVDHEVMDDHELIVIKLKMSETDCNG